MKTVWLALEETSIIGIFSSREEFIKYYAKANKMTAEEVEKEMNDSSGYPCVDEIQLDKAIYIDR